MRRIFLLVVSLLWVPLVLIGCQTTMDNETSNVERSKVSISTSKDIDQINTDFYKVYEDKETLEIFQNIFTSASKQDGIVDISEPEFDLEVIYNDGNKSGYHLWLGKKDERSTLMNVEDTHTIYSISQKGTNQLIDLVN